MIAIGLVFRKKHQPTYIEMKDQTFSFINKIMKKAKGVKEVKYALHPDPVYKKSFHSHIVFKDQIMDQIKSESERVLVASNWDRINTPGSGYYDHIDVLKSRYGEIRIHDVPDDNGFLVYMRGSKKKHSKMINSYYPLKQYQRLKELINELPF
ncbi:MAG: hypothetical protein ACON43_02540 [Flavobacteriaceae bacterium]